ncbi:MAG TPA: adenylate/guanylate cyclase domain-containing protein, partial [Alphaproteobacteria bacterium]
MIITCPSCAFDNPDHARFCGNCGISLALTCGACGHANAPSYNFCINCGTPLGARAPAVLPAPVAAAASAGWPVPAVAAEAGGTSWPVIADLGPERRHLTVLFADLVGSTELAQELDPEDLRVVMRAYETASSEVIERFGGYVAQYYGDGVLAYFGYPIAHEDAAERAVRAALALIEAVAQTRAPQPLRVRIGIHSGLVVVGMEKTGVPGKANSAVGETPNVAARLQALADPNTVLISAATSQLVRGRFVVEDAGAHALKGIGAEVQVFRVVGEIDGGRRQDRELGGELVPLVGRARDLEAILDRWVKARHGDGQVVLVSGEAGIGKSRLVHELRARLHTEPHILMRHHCSPYHQTSPLFPIAEAIAGAAGIDSGDAPAARLAKIGHWLERYDIAAEESLALVADLLMVPSEDGRPPLAMAPEQRKQRIFALLLAAVESAARDAPVLFEVGDLQWADPSTIEFLGLIVDQVATRRVLALLTHRPGFQPPWPARAHVLPLTLARLTAAESAAMAEHVAGGKALPQAVLDRIVERGDGVPMFIEELTRTVLASGFLEERDGRYELAGELPPVAIPASLQDSLMARLDRLGAYKEVAQIGAMLGRSFRADVLAAVSGLDADTLGEALAALVAGELLLQRGLPPHASYVFRQALVQEVAYQSLLRSRRQALHKQIAEVIEARFPDVAEAEPEALARHYQAAGVTDRALDYGRRASERAIRASAMKEALAHADGALALVSAMAPGSDVRRAEMELQVMRGIALGAVNGFGDPAVRTAYGRALEISRETGEREFEFRAL